MRILLLGLDVRYAFGKWSLGPTITFDLVDASPAHRDFQGGPAALWSLKCSKNTVLSCISVSVVSSAKAPGGVMPWPAIREKVEPFLKLHLALVLERQLKQRQIIRRGLLVPFYLKYRSTLGSWGRALLPPLYVVLAMDAFRVLWQPDNATAEQSTWDAAIESDLLPFEKALKRNFYDAIAQSHTNALRSEPLLPIEALSTDPTDAEMNRVFQLPTSTFLCRHSDPVGQNGTCSSVERYPEILHHAIARHSVARRDDRDSFAGVHLLDFDAKSWIDLSLYNPKISHEKWALELGGFLLNKVHGVTDKNKATKNFAFFCPVFYQCLLIHPVFPEYLSRPIRAALVLPSLKYALSTPFHYGFEPREVTIGYNFSLGITAAYGIWKTLEWGFVKDLTPYTWIGLDSDQEECTDVKGKQKVPLRKDKGRLEAIRHKSAATDAPLAVLSSQLHLFISMRGTGYAFGPSVKSIKETSYPTHPLRTFVKQHLVEIVRSHVLLVSAAAILVARPADLFPYAPSQVVRVLHPIFYTLAFGASAYNGINLAYSLFTLSILLATRLASFLPFPIPFLPPFDPREYHRLFYNTWSVESVTLFWGKGWHSFFRRSFTVLGTDLTTATITSLGGSITCARVYSIIIVFSLSAWLHEQALYSATYHTSVTEQPISFVMRWGGSIYFLLQAAAIIIEQTFTAVTKRQVGGRLGALWTLSFTAGLAQGMVSGIPGVAHWTWHRFVLPSACLAPPQLFAK
ncbi:hypothetical protein RQP46_010744 [Phenoliferia psychrophenolica]